MGEQQYNCPEYYPEFARNGTQRKYFQPTAKASWPSRLGLVAVADDNALYACLRKSDTLSTNEPVMICGVMWVIIVGSRGARMSDLLFCWVTYDGHWNI